MNVRELIDELKHLDPETKVGFYKASESTLEVLHHIYVQPNGKYVFLESSYPHDSTQPEL